MLIELTVKNFRSIHSAQTFNLTKSHSNELNENTFSPESNKEVTLLRSAAIYGANASGKSNFINSIRSMQYIVKKSSKDISRGEKLPVTPFKLSRNSINEPTEFEVLIISNGVKYQYGFALTANQVTEEWLYAFPRGRPQRWFIRAYDKEKNEYAWEFSNLFTGKKQLWRDATRENALFLSTAVMLNNEQLKPIYDWFNDTLKTTDIMGWSPNYTAKVCSEESGKLEVLKFLKAADLDISDIISEEKKIDQSFFPEDMPNEVKSSLLENIGETNYIDIKTIHKTEEGDDVLFDLDDESDGTKKLFSFAGPWIDSLRSGRVLFIDELHDSLHPSIVKFLVKLFNNKQTNPKNAQLVFSTHETSILDQQVFRRDQVWFCHKEKDQSTCIYPLTDFSPKKSVENLEKAYLSGRYGALPLTSTLDFQSLTKTTGE